MSKKADMRQDGLTSAPVFSLIIPTYQRPESLALCLDAISTIDCPHDRFEVIVVDDGSRDSLEPVIAPFRGPLDLKLLKQSNAGPAAARNNGATQAQGTYLVFTDDDCTPHRAWLRVLADRFDGTPDHMIGGHTINALADNVYAIASQELISYLYRDYGDQPGQARFFASNNMAMPASQFREIGGFDTTFPLAAGEDREFCDRWSDHGYELTHAPDAVIFHAHGLSLRKFWRQHFNYGRGAYHFRKLRSRRQQQPVRVEPVSFYINLLRYPFTQNPAHRALRISALLGISQVANAAGFFFEIINEKIKR